MSETTSEMLLRLRDTPIMEWLEHPCVVADEAIAEIDRLHAREAQLREALRGMEHAFVLLSEALRGSEVNIPLDAGLAIIQARETARATLAEDGEK